MFTPASTDAVPATPDNSQDGAQGGNAKVAVTAELLSTWLGFADVQRRTLDVVQGELTRTSDHVETSTLDLSERFRELAQKALEQSERVAQIVATGDCHGELLGDVPPELRSDLAGGPVQVFLPYAAL